MSIREQLGAMGQAAREAAELLREAPADQRSQAIRAIGAHLRARSAEILAANAADVAEATTMVDRLLLNPERLEAMASAIEDIAAIPDPVGEVTETWTRPNGLGIQRVSVPLGVIGMVFESRPNVTADAAGLCIKSATP